MKYYAQGSYKGRTVTVEADSADEAVDEVVRLESGAPMTFEDAVGPEPSVRTPPALDPSPLSGVQSPDKARCQECGGSLGPLEPEDAVELYGLRVCTPCGKNL